MTLVSLAAIALIALLGCVEQCRGADSECTPQDIPCCSGLSAVPLAIIEEDGTCIAALCGTICVPCGNGVCDERENKCNCPTDCLECVGEGETIPVVAELPECCPGLELIPPKEENWLGISGYCTALCGNGACDEATESSYNCPEDCAAEQVVGPEYYDSEQEAFDALGEELEDLEEPSADELEQMLGG
jgi:hypothetical protein